MSKLDFDTDINSRYNAPAMVNKDTTKSSKQTGDGDELEPILEEVELEDVEELTGNAVKRLKEKLKQCQEEKAQYLDGWQREKADLLNMKRRHSEEAAGREARALSEHVKKLLPLCDSFEMAFADTKTWEAADPTWKKGIEQIHAQLESILKSYDISVVGQVGEAFDPHLHEAVSSAPVEKEKLHDTIVTVYQKGYRAGDTLIRPAKVIVGEYTN